jgi:hypothetical protein
MPIMRATLPSGKQGYKFGQHGHVYPTKAGALKQMRAMYANGYTGNRVHTGAKHGHK